MHKPRYILFAALFIALALLLAACGNSADPVFKQQSAADPLNFKEAYEALNNELDDEGKPKYDPVEVPEDNNIVILDYDEMMKFFDSGSGVIYLGRSGCPWCRKLLPAMLDFAEREQINLYYYDVRDIREENGEPYRALLAKLDAYLPQDTVTQSEDDPDFDPELKRVVLPHFFFLSRGQVQAEWMAYRAEIIENNDYEQMSAKFDELYAAIKK